MFHTNNILFANDEINNNLYISYDGGENFFLLNNNPFFSSSFITLTQDSTIMFSGQSYRISKDYGKTIERKFFTDIKGDTIYRGNIDHIVEFKNGTILCATNRLSKANPLNNTTRVIIKKKGNNYWQEVPDSQKYNIPDTTQITTIGQSRTTKEVTLFDDVAISYMKQHQETLIYYYKSGDSVVYKNISSQLGTNTNNHISCMAFHHPDSGILGTVYRNYYYTTDGAKTLQQLNIPSNMIITRLLYIRPSKSKKGYYLASTQIDGVFSTSYSTDFGKTWTHHYEGILFHNLFSQNADLVIGVSSNKGIYVLQQLASVKTEEIKNIKLYPNPSNSTFVIQNLPDKTDIIIFDMQGKVVKETKDYYGQNLDISELNNGIFTVKCIIQNGKIYYSKLLVNK
ncbi:MAG: T9SS type A sorting domain-containing protein [Bacteroidia bacterium]